MLSEAFVREAGVAEAEAPFEAIKDRFNAIYQGADYDGLIATEPAAIQTATLEALAARYKLALVTGRPEADALWDAPPVRVARPRPRRRGDGPAGGPREARPARPRAPPWPDLDVEAEEAVYAGDTVDDMRAARAAGCVAVGVVPPGLDVLEHGRTLMGAGARVVLSTPDALPALLANVRLGRHERVALRRRAAAARYGAAVSPATPPASAASETGSGSVACSVGSGSQTHTNAAIARITTAETVVLAAYPTFA